MVDIEYVKKNCREGWMLNPNEKVVNGIIKGINRCNGECPCVNDAEEKTCPCSNYRLHEKCCCTLYVRKSTRSDVESLLRQGKRVCTGDLFHVLSMDFWSELTVIDLKHGGEGVRLATDEDCANSFVVEK